MRVIFSERTFIDVFCMKVSTILIENSVLHKCLKIQEYFDQTAIFRDLPILFTVLFAFVSTQKGALTSLGSKIIVFYWYKYDQFLIFIRIASFLLFNFAYQCKKSGTEKKVSKWKAGIFSNTIFHVGLGSQTEEFILAP